MEAWLEGEMQLLAAPMVAARMQEERPLLSLLAAGVALYALLGQLRGYLGTHVLPSLQAVSLQACLALGLESLACYRTAGEPLRSFAAPLSCLAQGLLLLLFVVALPRRVCALYVPHKDLLEHYRLTLGLLPLGAAERKPAVASREQALLLGGSESTDEEAEKELASSVQERNRRAVACSRAAAVVLVLLRSLLALLFRTEQKGLLALHAGLDTPMLSAGIVLVWLSTREVTTKVLGRVLPRYWQLSYTAMASVALFQLQSLVLLGLRLFTGEVSHNVAAMLRLINLFEAAFILVFAAHVLDARRDPLMTFALCRVGMGEPVTWRQHACQLMRALFDLRALYDAVAKEALPWPVRLGGLTTSEESSSEGTEESEESQVGRDAWRLWSRRTGAHPAWYGGLVNADAMHRAISQPLSVVREQLKVDEGDEELMKGSWWFRVPADLWTDRVRSKFLAVVLVVILVVKIYSRDLLYELCGRLTNPVAILAAQFLLMAAMWVLFGLMVLGNNAFLGDGWHRRWVGGVLVVCVAVAARAAQHFFRTADLGADENGRVALGQVFASVQRRWTDFSVGLLCVLGFFLALWQLLHPKRDNDFHKVHFNALWYTSELCTPAGDVSDLRQNPPRPGEQLQYNSKGMEGFVKASVDRDNGDGTCDVVLSDGRLLKHQRYKSLRREGSRLEEALDRQLGRFKELRSTAADFPAVLFLGAVTAFPILLAVACALLLAFRAMLHQLFRLHVLAALLGLCLDGSVVPATGSQEDLALRVLHWRFKGGQGLLGGETLRGAAGVEGLYVRWGEGNESLQACEHLPAAQPLLALMGRGSRSAALSREELQRGVEHVLMPSMGPDFAGRVADGARRVLDRLTNDGEDELDARALGLALCEAKLLASLPGTELRHALDLYHDLRDGFTSVAGLATNATRDLRLWLTHTADSSGVARPMLSELAGQAAGYLSQLERALARWGRGEGFSLAGVGKGVRSARSTLARARAVLSGSEAPTAALAVQLLDRDGDGKVSLLEEAPGMLRVAEGLCRRAGCSAMVEEKLWPLLASLGPDGSGQLDEDGLQRLLGALQEAYREGGRAVDAACSGDFSGLLVAFDGNGDSALSAAELLPPLARLAGAGASLLRAFRAMDKDGNGRLTLGEVGPEDLGGALAGLCKEGRRLEEEEEEEVAEEDAGATMELELGESASMERLTAMGRAFVGALSPSFVPIGLAALNWLLYLALVLSSFCQLYVIRRCFTRYRELFRDMQRGKHSYAGHTGRETLKSAFAETTLFPGMIFGTSLFGFIFVALLVFVLVLALAVLASPPMMGFWRSSWPVLLYLTLAWLVKQIISYVVMDLLLAEEGEIVYPVLFSLFWFFQLCLNFVLGVSTALFRAVLVLLWALVSCCFVDFTLMTEGLVEMDSAYYSLLTMAYTNHERSNPVKKAFVTLLFRHCQSLQMARSDEDSDPDQESACSTARSGGFNRARARFCLALTLHRNPELRSQRKHARKLKEEAG